MRTRRTLHPPARVAPLSLATLFVLLVIGVGTAPATGGTGQITGMVFEDLNRDGVKQSDEPPMAGRQVYLFNAQGKYLGTTLADDAGTYVFPNLAVGDYSVQCDSTVIRVDWVPSTTDADARIGVHVDGTATADFGWRTIVRSTDLAAPLATYVGGNGVTIEMYNDALPPARLYDDLSSGSLVGAEAPSVTIRFGYGDSSSTSAGAQQVNGVYSNYNAVVQIGWASWLNTGEQALFHEYGHAWSLYNAFVVQQDPALTAYLTVRGLAGDSRVNTSYGWSSREMIAEDYRQLFGSASAQSAPQMNTDIPPASSVPGLRDFLANLFTRPPTPVNMTPPTVQGSAVRGQTLTATTGSWTASPTRYGYEWERCDTSGANCGTILGATGSTYVAQSVDVGSTLAVRVSASNAAGSGSATSTPSLLIAPSVVTDTFTGTVTNKKTSQSFGLALGSGDAQAVLTFGAGNSLVLKLQSQSGGVIGSATGSAPVALTRSVAAAQYKYVVGLPQKARGSMSFTLKVAHVEP